MPGIIAPSSRKEGDQGLQLLKKFHSRTIFSITTDKTLRIYQDNMINLACSVSPLTPITRTLLTLVTQHQYLIHALFTLILMHDRHLLPTPVTRLSTAEAYHWQRAIVLFNAKLSGRIDASERDAVWATTVLIGIVTLCHIEATTVDEAWPVAAPSSLDLNWLRMSDLKKGIWNLAGLDKAGSIIQPWGLLASTSPPPGQVTAQEFSPLPAELLHLLALSPTCSSPTTNPYRAAASALAQCVRIDHGIPIIVSFLSFISNLQPGYKKLLEVKDPRGLLVLAWWYAKVSKVEECWWTWRRAVLEGRAICRYLEGWAKEMGEGVEELVECPRKAFDAVNC